MEAGVYNITINRGATFTLSISWKDENNNPIDLAGYSAAAQGKPTYDSEEYIFYASSDLEEEDITGIIEFDDNNIGYFLLTIEASETALISHRTGVWDLILTAPSGKVTRLLQGRVTVSDRVTVIPEDEP
jgi:hypothetical protein